MKYVFHAAIEMEERLCWRADSSACSEAVNNKDALTLEKPAPVPIQHQEGLLWLLIQGSVNSKTLCLCESENSCGTLCLRITC